MSGAGGADPAAAAAGQAIEAQARQGEIGDLTRRVVLSAILTAPVLLAVMTVEAFKATWVPALLLNHWWQLALISPVMFYAGWPIHRTGWLALRHRAADMNTPGHARYHRRLRVQPAGDPLAPTLLPANVRDVYFEAVGVILTLILLGRFLEAKAKAGTGEAIRALIGLQPHTAHLQRGGTEADIDVAEVTVVTCSSSGPGRRSRSTGGCSLAVRRSMNRWSPASRCRSAR